MTKKIALIFTVTWFLFSFQSFSQSVDYENIIFDNYIYHEDMASVKLAVKDVHFASPVITLFSDEKIILTFDDLSGAVRYIKYTLIHCSHDWKPTTNLNVHEYMTGFEEGEILDFENSLNTIQPYVSFSLTLPNEDVKVNKSGNYLLYVYEDGRNGIVPLFTRRLMIVENWLTLSPTIKQSSNIMERFTHQEITFQLNWNNRQLNNPSQNIKVLIMQNDRYDNALLIKQPYISQANTLLYTQRGGITMEGGNEYRIFNIKSFRATLENVSRVSYINGENHIFLYPSEERSYKSYVNETDIHGYYFNETSDFASSNEADYANVHFRLAYNKPVDGDIYVFGELTNWQFTEAGKMAYNKATDLWQTTLFLKAGYYNYLYLFVPKNSHIASTKLIEGSHWETKNKYSFFVYYNADPASYDRIIGYTNTFSFSDN